MVGIAGQPQPRSLSVPLLARIEDGVVGLTGVIVSAQYAHRHPTSRAVEVQHVGLRLRALSTLGWSSVSRWLCGIGGGAGGGCWRGLPIVRVPRKLQRPQFRLLVGVDAEVDQVLLQLQLVVQAIFETAEILVLQNCLDE